MAERWDICVMDQLTPKEDQPTEWFETLYASSNPEGTGVPWANMDVHPQFAEWLGQHELNGEGKCALVVGCGMGDDAIALEQLGFKVTAFDVAPSAIELCKKRFVDTTVDFMVADLFDPPSEWKNHFDFVLEIFTVQALPPKYEVELIANVASFVAKEGQLLVVASVQDGPRSFEQGPPWLLRPDHVDRFSGHGLESIESYRLIGADRMGDLMVTTFLRR